MREMAADSTINQSALQVSYYVHFRYHASLMPFILCRFVLLTSIIATIHGLIPISLNFSFTYSIIY